jgi:TolB-like protein
MRYAFDGFVLDSERRELRRSGKLVPLEPQLFDLLELLLRCGDRVVTREELIAEIWGGRIVSESALNSRISTIRSAIGDNGRAQRLIKTFPRKGIRFVGRVAGTRPVRTRVASKSPRERRSSIAVLPFANMDGDSRLDYFSDGVAENILIALSRFPNLFVVARGSSFTFRDVDFDSKRIRRELGVRYLLAGSVRKSETRVRLAFQLLDAASAQCLVADSVEGLLNDIFGLQDQITTRVVGALIPRLSRAEIELSLAKPTDRLDAYDYYLRGIARSHEYSRKSNDEALVLFQKATEFDPRLANAHASAAMCFEMRIRNGWTGDIKGDARNAVLLGRRAAALGPDDANALAAAGFVLARIARDVGGGAALIDRALSLNPNAARAWQFSAWVRVWLGDPQVAIEHATLAIRFSPMDPGLYSMQAAIAFAHFYMKSFDEAASWAAASLRNRADFQPAWRILAASHALAGRTKQAQEAMAEHRLLNPGLTISKLKARGAPHPGNYFATFARGLRAAGLPW